MHFAIRYLRNQEAALPSSIGIDLATHLQIYFHKELFTFLEFLPVIIIITVMASRRSQYQLKSVLILLCTFLLLLLLLPKRVDAHPRRKITRKTRQCFDKCFDCKHLIKGFKAHLCRQTCWDFNGNLHLDCTDARTFEPYGLVWWNRRDEREQWRVRLDPVVVLVDK